MAQPRWLQPISRSMKLCLRLAAVYGLLGGLGVAQAGFLLPSAEMASRSQLACQPSLIMGLMECETLPEPAPPVQNDPAIVPAEFVRPSEQIATLGAVIDDTPQQPFLDVVPTQVKAGRFSLSWQNGFGAVGQWWEVWDNQQLRYRGKDFISRPLRPNAANSLDSIQSHDVKEVSLKDVQGGVFTIEQLEPGLHQWQVSLCRGTLAAPQCSHAYAQTWAETAGDAAAVIKKPAPPELAWTAPVITDGKALLKWDVYWGNVGTQWEVLQAGKAIYRSSQFTETTENSQSAQVELPLVNGVYSLSIRLCNANLCSESAPVTVEAMLGPNWAPSQPSVKVYTDADPELGNGLPVGQVIVSWQTTGPSVAPDHWLLLDADRRQVMFSQKISQPCQAGVWCGSWQGTPATRLANWLVKLCRAKQCIDAVPVTVPALPR
ncbi:chitinase N-terminal domain-containing protein [Deefgea salmonis]|uniref:Chitinase A N-terminal domain-containing protein n=1 Tax=Deefgea salmonis TaxID=2875502 RepID=A0ABS8BHP8_9NEIS|nr:chitinase N-terminal domain-containing protein [Deefgea salmonis]MCB5195157.1 hypothetical protein [Deefgea salmonis]